jgi:hypothetical protein
MKKKINAQAIADELRDGSVFFADARQRAEAEARPEELEENQPMTAPADVPASQPVGPSTQRSAVRSTRQSTTGETGQPSGPSFDTTMILGRPKAFYITEKQDKALDVAVDKLAARLNGRGNQKIDRSTVVRLLLEMSDVADDTTVDRMASHMVSRLVSQLTG